MKPNFEPFVHTARDLVERDITLYMWPTAMIWRQMLSQSDNPEYRKIAETIIISESWDQYYAMTRNEMLSRGTHATMAPMMNGFRTLLNYQGEYKYNHGRGVYRGDRVRLAGAVPQSGYLTNKMWHLNEVKT